MKEFFYSGTVYKDSSCQAVIGKVSGIANDYVPEQWPRNADELLEKIEIMERQKFPIDGCFVHIEAFYVVNNGEGE